MDWVVLVMSGVLEAVWATALAASQGFRKRVPLLVFLIAGAASMLGLAYAMRTLPTSTAYAVWVGIGAVLTVVLAVIRKEERLTLVRTLLLVGLIASVIGLKVVG